MAKLSHFDSSGQAHMVDVGAKTESGRVAVAEGWIRMPLCHPIALTHASAEFDLDEAGSRVGCRARVECSGKTGVEMEALTAVQVALLTIYDMCKAVDRGMVIESVRLLEKHGGKSGSFVAERK